MIKGQKLKIENAPNSPSNVEWKRMKDNSIILSDFHFLPLQSKIHAYYDSVTYGKRICGKKNKKWKNVLVEHFT